MLTWIHTEKKTEKKEKKKQKKREKKGKRKMIQKMIQNDKEMEIKEKKRHKNYCEYLKKIEKDKQR